MENVGPEELCGNCGHAYKFHVGVDGVGQPCDVTEHIGAVYDEARCTPSLCGCPQFEQIADPEEVSSEYKN